MATPAHTALGKETRKRINMLPDLIKRVEEFSAHWKELYDVVIAGNPKENTASLVERVRNLEDFVKDLKNFMIFMRGSMTALILKAVWDIFVR